MSKKSSAKVVALMSVMTALVYAMTSLAWPMPHPLGVWHIGDIASSIAAILCGPYVGAFACGVGAAIFDVWNPLLGSALWYYAPVTIFIRGSMGFLMGSLRQIIPGKPKTSEMIVMILGAIQKNLCYLLYDYVLFGWAVASFDLTFFPLSAFSIVVTVPLLVSLRKALKLDYLL